MNNQLTVIPNEQLHLVSGGAVNYGKIVAIGGAVVAVAELPHIFMGIREFTNYVGDRMKNGVKVENGDYFTQFFVNAYLFATSK